MVERFEEGLEFGGLGRNFEDSINWKVGYGKEVFFRGDNWVGSGALKNVFPRLFSLSLSKDFAVVAFGGWNNGKWDWNLFEWEKQIVVLFSQAVQGASFDLDKEDGSGRKGRSSGIRLNRLTSI